MPSSFDTEHETPEFDNLAKLAENVVYLLPGCSDLMVRKILQEVYRDFCRRSCCLRGRRRFDLTGHAVPVAPMFGGLVDCVTEVRYDGVPLVVHRDYDVRDGVPPVVCVSPRLVPRPGERVPVVEISTVEVPSISSEQIPHGFIDSYGEYICAGALSRLMSMTGRPWSDPQQAADARIRYENGVGETRMRHHSGALNGNAVVEFVPDTSVLI